MPRRPAHPAPESDGAREREELSESLRGRLLDAGMDRFVTAVARAARDRSAIAASLLSFRGDRDLLYGCLAYAHLACVRIVIEPEVFRGLQRRHGSAHARPPLRE